ncbi:MAG: potassium-transporting ATPase subunit KdpC [Candidatus Binataceae bacterium]|jgi:K+-transporting ATPase ATPase C chain
MGIWTAFKMTIVLTLLTGIIYPLAIAGLAGLMFPFQAHGSLIMRDGHVVGSELIGQNFTSARYFHGRPSAAGDKGYDASNSGGSNLGPTNRTLIEAVRLRLRDVIEKNAVNVPARVPIDLVTTSGSGLDPQISPAAADLEVRRVATARGLSEDTVRALVVAHTSSRWAGVFGEPVVNVLELNLALDDLVASVHGGSARNR